MEKIATSNKYRSKITLWLLVLLFASPFMIAGILVFNKENLKLTTNQTGQLLNPPFKLQISAAHTVHAQKWKVLFLTKEKCNSATCIERKKMLHNLHLALGADKQRVQILTIPSNHIKTTEPIGYKALLLTKGSIIIIDPHGNAMMRYAPKANMDGILKDMRRLLKYSSAR